MPAMSFPVAGGCTVEPLSAFWGGCWGVLGASRVTHQQQGSPVGTHPVMGAVFGCAAGGWHEASAHLVLALPSCVLQPFPLAESWLPTLPAAPWPCLQPPAPLCSLPALPLPLQDLPHARSSLLETLISNFIRPAPADLHNPHNHPGFNCLQLCRKIMWLSGKS